MLPEEQALMYDRAKTWNEDELVQGSQILQPPYDSACASDEGYLDVDSNPTGSAGGITHDHVHTKAPTFSFDGDNIENVEVDEVDI